MTEKHSEALKALETAVGSLVASGEWSAYLRTRKRFHNYSFGNRLMIWSQRPEATRVAGFHAWKDLGRSVQKGEKGIAIFAPLVKKERDESTGEEKRVVKGFRIAYVFDIEQTAGEDLPSEPDWQCVNGATGDCGAILRRLEAVATSEGLTWAYEDTGSAGGSYSPSRRHIAISATADQPMQVRAFVHELVHSLGAIKGAQLVEDSEGDPLVEDATYADAEIITDAAAALVLESLGLDSVESTAAYLAIWAQGETDKIRHWFENAERYATRLENLIAEQKGE